MRDPEIPRGDEEDGIAKFMWQDGDVEFIEGDDRKGVEWTTGLLLEEQT